MSSKQDEKLMILKMLDEGKITLEEANELLEALYARSEELAEEDWSRDFKKGLRGLKDGMEKGISEARDGLQKGRTEIEKETEGLGSFLKSIFDSFSTGVVGGGYNFTDSETGSFTGDNVEIDLDTRNGNIEITESIGDQFELEINSRVRAENEEKAQNKKSRGMEIQKESNRLSFRVTEREIVANVRLSLPKKHLYNLNLDTSNGRVEISGLQADKVEADTSNGRIVFRDMSGKIFRADTSNGRIEMKNVKGDEFIADTSNGSIYIQGEGQFFNGDTSNGSITIEPKFKADGEIKADTSNGRIKLHLPRGEDIGYSLEASTSMGSLNIELPEIEYSEKQESYSRKKAVGKTRGYQEKRIKVEIEAQSSMGSIYLG